MSEALVNDYRALEVSALSKEGRLMRHASLQKVKSKKLRD